MIDTKEMSKSSRRRKKYFSYYEKEKYSVDFLVIPIFEISTLSIGFIIVKDCRNFAKTAN